jgi:hypothetical protein
VIALEDFVRDFARALSAVDALSPVAVNVRSKAAYQPGIGPHTEAQTVRLVMASLAASEPGVYGDYRLGVPYGDGSRQSCDLCLGQPPGEVWAVEVKMLRLMGDNGKPNDNILMHILSPYPEHRSALTDCAKLAAARLGSRRAVLIYGYDYPGWPMDPAIDAFAALAERSVVLGPVAVSGFDGLVHPVHRRGRVFAWEILGVRGSR